MPNESITVVYKATDQFSATVKTMQATARAFTKDLDSLQSKLNTLNKTKISLQLDTDKAKKGLLEVQKQFSSTSGVLERLVKNGNRLNFDSIQQSLASVTKEAAGAEKQISKAMNAIGTKGNGTNDKFFSTFTEGMLKTGSAQIVGQMAQEWMTSIVGSAMGTEGKTLISSVVPAIISGMMLGNMVPLIGPFIGAVAGAGVGVLSGMAANNQSRDDAYKAWYKGLYEDAGGVTDASLTAGGVLASARERDRISFATLFGDEGTAEGYLKSLVGMANTTPFLYSDLTAMSKTLATYGYDEKSILPVLRTVGDAGAALGMTVSDMNAAATAIGRMKSSDKATLEYLNILNDRGIGAVGYLAEARGVSVGDMYGMISKGEITGGEAADILLAAMERDFSGSMLKQSQTFEGLTSTLTGILQEADNAMGEGYNNERSRSLADQIEGYGGALGEALAEANKAIGAGRAALDNLSDQYTQEALEAVLTGKETALDWSDQNAGRLKELGSLYQEAMADYRSGNTQAGARVETLLEEARALATAEYQSGDAMLARTEAENAMIDAIRENTQALNGWQNNYGIQQNLSKGRLGLSKDVDIGGTVSAAIGSGKGMGRGYAYGLDYVPYDNFPALLHQGERVQTAAEARSGGNVSVTVTGNTFSIREEADVDRVAEALLEKMELADVRG